MENVQIIAYNTGALLCALYMLERGADIFIDHTAIVAKRTGIPQGLIALLTAGAEWEELAVFVICLARKRPALALGNVIGSAISNILGAFSLGLLFRRDQTFDRSSRIYTAVLLAVTIIACGLLQIGRHLRVAGGIFIGLFAVYIASIALLIARGLTSAPEEMSDSDSDSDVSEADSDSHAPVLQSGQPAYGTFDSSTGSLNPVADRQRHRSLLYHISMLLLGLAAVIVSSYVLANAAANLADQSGISDIVFGTVVLAIATTLPEKMITLLSGYKGHPDIMVANTVGSNIFLLTLCLGIVWVVTGGDYGGRSLALTEILTTLASTAALAATVFGKGSYARLIGISMLVGYIVFLVLEVTVIHGLGGVDGD